MFDPRPMAAALVVVVSFHVPAVGQVPVGPPPPGVQPGSWLQAVVAGQRVSAAGPDGPRAGTGCGWLAPVDAPVADPFRPPGHPYGPGNRGIEYGTEPGDPVVAVDDGRATFVGPVAGRLFLVITHRGELRSTYGPLTTASVVSGQAVLAGQLMATAAGGFHLTARLDGRYLDPTPLLEGRCLRPRLLPLPTPSNTPMATPAP